jgi:ubiquinone/menaquinone biosynthesis C-methylase UbiE
MTESSLTLEEVEKLGYYDFMSYLGVPFFHLGGPKSTLELAGMCHIEKGKKVLVVGCGTGFSACFLAKKLGCSVVGVDIAQVSVKKSNDRAKQENVDGRVKFQIGDAHNLTFKDNTFDAVITEFVSMFLDKDKAFKEFARVLKPGGFLGINELFKDSDIPADIFEEILGIEQTVRNLTSLSFQIETPERWKVSYENANLKNVQIHDHKELMGIKDLPFTVESLGGIGQLLKLLSSIIPGMIRYSVLSKTIRSWMKQLAKVKKALMRQKSTSKHVGYILGVAKKGS